MTPAGETVDGQPNFQSEHRAQMRRTILVAFGTLVAGSLAFSPMTGNLATLVSTARAEGTLIGTGIALPNMNAERGKVLFATKGCVVCHSINGVGGADAAPLDASTMDPTMNPFEFFARMLAGMAPMIAMQEDRLGQQVQLNAEELGDIVAFIHDETVQKSFSEENIPENIEDLIEDD